MDGGDGLDIVWYLSAPPVRVNLGVSQTVNNASVPVITNAFLPANQATGEGTAHVDGGNS